MTINNNPNQSDFTPLSDTDLEQAQGGYGSSYYHAPGRSNGVPSSTGLWGHGRPDTAAAAEERMGQSQSSIASILNRFIPADQSNDPEPTPTYRIFGMGRTRRYRRGRWQNR